MAVASFGRAIGTSSKRPGQCQGLQQTRRKAAFGEGGSRRRDTSARPAQAACGRQHLERHVGTFVAPTHPTWSATLLTNAQLFFILACRFSQQTQVNVSLDLARLQLAPEIGICVHDSGHLWQVRCM